MIFYGLKISCLYLLYFLKYINFYFHMIEWDKLIFINLTWIGFKSYVENCALNSDRVKYENFNFRKKNIKISKINDSFNR